MRIAVPILPHIANFDDLDPLEAEPAVDLMLVRPGAALPGDADLVILPGSKATIADLAALRAAGLGHRHRGASCGAAGVCSASAAAIRCSARSIADPDGIEGPPGNVAGSRPARGRDGAVGRQAPRAGAGHDRTMAFRSAATRCISA